MSETAAARMGAQQALGAGRAHGGGAHHTAHHPVTHVVHAAARGPCSDIEGMHGARGRGQCSASGLQGSVHRAWGKGEGGGMRGSAHLDYKGLPITLPRTRCRSSLRVAPPVFCPVLSPSLLSPPPVPPPHCLPLPPQDRPALILLSPVNTPSAPPSPTPASLNRTGQLSSSSRR